MNVVELLEKLIELKMELRETRNNFYMADHEQFLKKQLQGVRQQLLANLDEQSILSALEVNL